MTRSTKPASEDDDMSLEEEVKKLSDRFDEAERICRPPKSKATTAERLLHARWAVVAAGFRNDVSMLGYETDVNLYHRISGAHDDAAIPLMLDLAKKPDPAVAAWARDFESKYVKHLNDAGRFYDPESDFVLITCKDLYDPDHEMLEDD